MNAEQKKSIKSTILECRDILEEDIEQVLINYGIYINKDWVNLRDLKNLTEKQEKNRKNIEKAIEKLKKGGFEKDKAVIEYIKEVSYTYLNRLAALRVMEVRGLIDEILIPRGEYGNRSFIGSRFYEVAREYCKYEMDGGLAYLLNIMFEEISEEIKMLFNTEDEYSFVTPSSTSLLKVIELLCSNIDEESWRQDEIIGWIYQYFNSIEKSEIYTRQDQKDFFISVDEVPATTQIFTPDWVVNWIIDNSLYKVYSEMKNGLRDKKNVEDIKLIDPCCGSGHFLVRAYDVFFEMYLEEGKYTIEEIPYKILENNIHGIDIDLRAVQLTGLILFIKTKTYLKENGYNTNTKGKLSVNLVCADAILLNGSRLEDLKEKHKNNKTILKMIEIIYEEFEDVRLKGSLIQPEKKLFPLFEEFKNRIARKELSKAKRTKKKQTKGQENLLEDQTISFDEYKSQRDFTKEERELMDSLNAIYSEAIKANDISRQLFATEATKSIKLVNIFMQKTGYDVVVTNPPYMGIGNMDIKLKNFIISNYNAGSEDLYSAFIMRCEEFLNENGILGMIVQHGFMFTPKYKDLRKNILEFNQIEKVVHLGTGIFEELTGEKVNSVMFTLNKTKQENLKSEFVDITSCENRADYPNITEGIKEYQINQEKFKIIKGYPFTYKLSENILNYFLKSNYKEYAHVQRGISTYANYKYIRFYWEVNNYEKWKWINQIPGGDRYVSLDNTVVDFSENAIEFYKSKGGYTGINYFNTEGMYYPRSPYGANFSAKYLHENTIIEDDKPGIFPKKGVDNFFLLGLMNSNLIIYFLNVINPTNHCQVGDVNRLPIKKFSLENNNIIKKNVLENIEDLRHKYSLIEISRYFNFENIIKLLSDSMEMTILNFLNIKDKIDLDVYNRDEIINRLVYDTYKISEDEVEFIEEENGVNNNIDVDKSDYIKLINEDNNPNYNLVSKKLNLRKDILIKKRIEEKLYGDKAIKKELENIISILIGCIFDRWNNDIKSIDDGIVPVNSSIYLEKDIIEQIYIIIGKYFGVENSDNTFEEIEEILGTTLEKYIINDFFKNHSRSYKKRPIYWHICSPKKTFNCFVYYHKLDDDTLYKVKSIYLSQMIDRYEEDLEYYTNQLIEARTNGDKSKEKDVKDKCSDLEAKLEDLSILDKKIMEILPYKPNIDEGVLYNIIPIEPILSAPVATKRERDNYYEEVGT
ncbi:BREX-1 system adenine-specific DNA-methyltransferase PglX [Tissierella sp. MB52-C2]|uniref:BREX-1 system adenine-specific DNA-methyltransferase PglX n=1 Tax=Tissierella sp. MB52-C2 TaxID=3070999 RepID=UPI00280BC6F9|nr:BREX-1 system adenine-specific DNA-methyltransferase PglX [Tissierella sp. MB52-C2]WMM23480.1 BREX-1 system adenine-specific DNA-methyltransferase PglX [Tissierella sp. MB52-C2]